jgi:cytoskeletal protein CcmA (bactofilin family)
MFGKSGKAERQAGRNGASLSFIGADASITGDLTAAGELHIDGKVSGDVRCAALVLGPSGEVRGNIKAEEARLAGLVDGGVEAGSLALDSSARITGDVLYDRLSIDAGAEVEGRFRRRRGEADRLPEPAPPIEAVKPRRRGGAPAPLFGEEAPTAEAAE